MTTVFGYDATILIDVCKAVIRAGAEGKLRNPKIATQAAIIIGASANRPMVSNAASGSP